MTGVIYRQSGVRSRVCAAAFAAVLLVSAPQVQAAEYALGDKGGEIPEIQKVLMERGYKPIVNGVYDKETKWAVRLFQEANGLTVNGIVDGVTYKALLGREMPESITKDKAKEKELGLNAAERKWVRGGSKTYDTETLTGSTDEKKSAVKPPKAGSLEVRDLLEEAYRHIGVPYRFGGTTPKGFDCSGYVRFVFERYGVHLPRMADEQYKVGKSVSKKNLQPGDLVFFETYTSGVSHSGIYVGDNRFISATSSRGVTVAPMDDAYWGKRYIGAKRVLH